MTGITKCPECEKEGKKSCLYGGNVGVMTAMHCAPFHDEEGVYHHHDGNSFTARMHCSNGHNLTVKSYKSCPTCGWTAKETKVEVEGTDTK